jgi:hypothetical protein
MSEQPTDNRMVWIIAIIMLVIFGFNIRSCVMNGPDECYSTGPLTPC